MSREEIRQLVQVRQPLCLTITVPLEHSPDDRVTVQAVLGRASAVLQQNGLSAVAARQRLDGLQALLDDGAFWQEACSGLVALVSDDAARCHRVAGPLPESVLVADRFDPVAVLWLLARVEEFAVLALSENQVRLLRYAVGKPPELVDLGMATDLNHFAVWEDREEQLQWHSTGSPQSGQASAAFHGSGSWDDTERREEQNFLTALAKAVARHIGPAVPVVLAGVQRLTHAMRSALARCQVVADTIHGNPDALSAAELGRLGLPLVSAHFARRDLKRAAATQRLSLHLATYNSQEIVRAAHEGRVQALFVELGQPLQGEDSPPPAGGASRAAAQMRDAVAVALRETLRFGGEVLPLPAGSLAGGMLAVFRYEVVRPQQQATALAAQ